MRILNLSKYAGCARMLRNSFKPSLEVQEIANAGSSQVRVPGFNDNRLIFSRILCTTAESPSPQPERPKKPFASKPRSLEVPDRKILNPSMPQYQKAILYVAGYYSRESELTRGAQKLLKEITAQCTNDEIFEALQLEKTFRTKFALMSLHVWLCLFRLRQEGKDGKEMSQTLYDLFQEDVEKRVYDAGVKVRVSKWLQELETYFYGSVMAYDKALGVGSSGKDLPIALWRNVYGSEGEKRGAITLASYVRRELASLNMTDSKAVLNGNLKFSRDY